MILFLQLSFDGSGITPTPQVPASLLRLSFQIPLRNFPRLAEEKMLMLSLFSAVS
jgi:hypothetical protein